MNAGFSEFFIYGNEFISEHTISIKFLLRYIRLKSERTLRCNCNTLSVH